MRTLGTVLVIALFGCTQATGGSSSPSTTSPIVTTTPPATSTTIRPAVSTTTTAESATTTTVTSMAPAGLRIEAFPVPTGSRPHDVAPAADGGVWYTAQHLGELGWLDPVTGETRHIDLGDGSRPHGVIVAEDGTPWITDGGLNAIVSVDPDTDEVTIHPLPDTAADANLNTAVFDANGDLWFTGQAGVYGVLEMETGEMVIHEAPGGRGPYGITVTPDGTVFYASLAGSFVGEIDEAGDTIVRDPPTADQGARRVWSDSTGSVWLSEWNSGNVSRFDPTSEVWTTWELPGEAATYAVYVDETDVVWLSDFGANALVRFDPVTETFIQYRLPHDSGEVRQILGRPGEVWGAESATDHLVLIRTR